MIRKPRGLGIKFDCTKVMKMKKLIFEVEIICRFFHLEANVLLSQPLCDMSMWIIKGWRDGFFNREWLHSVQFKTQLICRFIHSNPINPIEARILLT